jgi:hypothetical protein
MTTSFPLKMRSSDRFDDSLRGKIAPKGGRGYDDPTHEENPRRNDHLAIIHEKHKHHFRAKTGWGDS